MRVVATKLAGCVVIEPRVFTDHRGCFLETYNRQRYSEAGIASEFVQDNQSHSIRGTLRGLHYQVDRPQGKLVWAVSGEIFDVAVDLRRSSATFGQWVSVVLSAENRRQIYVPPGFAHGFYCVSATADVIYKCTDVYSPAGERTILWNDPQLAVTWPGDSPLLSPKDEQGFTFASAPYFD